MKYLFALRASFLLSGGGFVLSVLALVLWRYNPWGFKWSFDIGSAILLASVMMFFLGWMIVVYKLNHEHFGVDTE